MGPLDLQVLIQDLQKANMPGVLVPPGDDAGVFQLVEDLLLVETVDVITPVANDPHIFGSIAATNALSDIFAMGATPRTALCILGFSSCDTEREVVLEILRGADEVFQREGVALLGGHTFEDPELKVGFSITGLTTKDRLLTVKGAEEGNILLLTKPIGTGVIVTALKGEKLTDEEMQEALSWMTLSNRTASELALRAGATACTDVTGFGLLGHAYNIIREEPLDLVIDSDSVPLLAGVMDLVEMGIVPEGAYDNLKFLQGVADFTGVPEEKQLILSDPQTSGGLLITLSEEGLREFEEARIFYKKIGHVTSGKGRLRVT